MEIRSCCLNADGLCEVQLTSLYRESGSTTYIAFGDWADGMRSPCVWFDGGSDFTACIKNAPVMRFNIFRLRRVDKLCTVNGTIVDVAKIEIFQRKILVICE